MLSRLFTVLSLGVVLLSCAAPQLEDDIDHNSPPSDKQADSGEDRGFDPCRLNSNLPVCN